MNANSKHSPMTDDLVALLKQRRMKAVEERTEVLESLAEYQRRALELDKTIGAIDELLDIEGGTDVDVSAEGPAGAGPVRLKEFLLEMLADRKRRTTDELLELADVAGIDFEGKSPPKTVNITLLGLSRGNQVEMVEPGIWRRVD